MALKHFDEKSFDEALAQKGLLVVDFWQEKVLASQFMRTAGDIELTLSDRVQTWHLVCAILCDLITHNNLLLNVQNIVKTQ